MNDAEREELIQEIGKLREQRRFSDIALKLGRRDKEGSLREPALIVELADAYNVLFRYDEGLGVLRTHRRLILSTGNGTLIRRFLYAFSIQLRYRGRIRMAQRIAEELMVAVVEDVDQRLQASLYNGLGIGAAMVGEVDRALTWFGRATLTWQKMGDSRQMGLAHYNCGLIANLWGRIPEAAASFDLAEEYYGREGTLEEKLCVRSSRALVAMAEGDEILAEELADWCLAESEKVESVSLRASILASKGKLCLMGGRIVDAERFFRSALKQAATTGDVFDQAEISGELAIALKMRGSLKESDKLLTESIEKYSSFGGYPYARRIRNRYELVS